MSFPDCRMQDSFTQINMKIIVHIKFSGYEFLVLLDWGYKRRGASDARRRIGGNQHFEYLAEGI